MKKVLCKHTFKNVEISFDVKVSEIIQGESTKSSNNILLDREKLLNSGIGEFKQEQKDYKIRGLDIVVGKNFTDIATCLSQIKSEYDFIQVAGKVRYFTERTFKKKVVKDEVESEEEKIYFTFELFDGFGKIKASYFPTKAFMEKQIKIEDGQIVTICGKIEEYRESLSLKVKEIAFCCLPEGQLPEKREENLTVNQEVKIENESMCKVDYKTEPENYMVAFPSDYKEPNQMDLFASFGNVEQVCDMLDGKDYVVFDLETTGLDYSKNEIIEIGAVKVRNGKIIEVFNTFCKPSQSISSFITELTGISDDMVAFAPKFEDIVGDFFKFTRNSTLVAHNSDFDTLFLDYHAGKFMYKFDNPVIDTLVMSRRLLSGMKNHKLATIAKHFNIPLDHAHRALYDTIATAKCFIELCKLEYK
ncbi:MAG: hypothetical protein IJZ29_05125 [Clostridia bacterium]|nr:hypothetical protein [Clostridia bacterium]